MLTDDLRADIKAMKKANPQMSMRELGNMYKLSQTTIHKALSDLPISVNRPGMGHRMRLQEDRRSGHGDGGMTVNYTYHWQPRDLPQPKLPVVDNGFIRPPTREQLMGGR